MANNKPGKICSLKKGKLIDTQSGFVDTFNWMASFLDDLTKGANAKLQEVTIVTESKYDTSTHKFIHKTRKARVIVLDTSAKDSTVFEATPLTEEY